MKILVKSALSYRKPLAVKEVLLYENGEAFSVCPRCKTTLERDYQRFCDRCGQHLDWKNFDKVRIVMYKKHF